MKNRGRPKKAGNEILVARIPLLVSNKEKALVEKEAEEKGESVNQFLRDLIFSNITTN